MKLTVIQIWDIMKHYETIIFSRKGLTLTNTETKSVNDSAEVVSNGSGCAVPIRWDPSVSARLGGFNCRSLCRFCSARREGGTELWKVGFIRMFYVGILVLFNGRSRSIWEFGECVENAWRMLLTVFWLLGTSLNDCRKNIAWCGGLVHRSSRSGWSVWGLMTNSNLFTVHTIA